ncbi:MAG: hypothetical protein ACOYM2_04175 [Rectinemataceae bacterium]
MTFRAHFPATSLPSFIALLCSMMLSAPAQSGAQDLSSGQGETEVVQFDDLFSEPGSDRVVEDSGIDHLQAFEETATTRVSGSYSGVFSAAAGWKEWPLLENPRTGLTTSAGFLGTAGISLDARPDRAFHLVTDLSLIYDPRSDGVYTWNFAKVIVTDLYVDYNLADLAFLRFGQFLWTSGQGRLFMPGNLTSDAETGFTLRVSFPTLLSGVTVAALAQSDLFEDSEAPAWRELGVVAGLDQIIGPVRIGFTGRYSVAEGGSCLMSVKGPLYGTDLFFDGVVTDNATGTIGFKALGGFFREWKNVQAYGEYSMEMRASPTVAWYPGSLGLVLVSREFMNTPFKAGLQWLHSVTDGSGCLTLGASWVLASHVSAKLALPISYGVSGSSYVSSSLNLDPLKRRLALVLMVTVEGSI